MDRTRVRWWRWAPGWPRRLAMGMGAAVLLTVLPVPVLAATAADLAVDLTVVDDARDLHTVRVRLTNLGPADSTHAIANVTVDGAAIRDHDADPQPGSRDDGVGCDATADGTQLSCSWDVIPSNSAQTFDVAVMVQRHATVAVEAVAAGTPDPNPQANNTDSVTLQPAVADLAITDVTLDPVHSREDPTAPAATGRVAMTTTIAHRAGRQAEVILHVTPDARVHLSAPCQPADDQVWTCGAGVMAPGQVVSVVIELDRPEPGEEPLLLALQARPGGLHDPDLQAASARVGIQPRTPVPGQVIRHAGADRVATAIAISQARFPPDQAAAVVLARADNHADALAGGPLAADLDGPILLTAPGALSRATAAEIDRVLDHGSTVHLLGGTAALSADVAEAVRAAGYRVNRIAGPNRYATAVQVWEALGRPRSVAAADGDTHTDAVVGGAAMASVGGALLLTSGDRVPAELSPVAGHVDHAVGQPAARALPTATALHGDTPAATSVAVARAFFAAPDAVGLATSTQFPDALAGGPLTAALQAPLLLSDGAELSAEVTEYLRDTSTITTAHLLGGTAALSTDVQQQVADRIAR